MTPRIGIVHREENEKSGMGVFQSRIVPRLLDYTGCESVVYDVASSPPWRNILERYRLSRDLRSRIEPFDVVFLPTQNLLLTDLTESETAIVPYLHDLFPAVAAFANPIEAILGRRIARNTAECDRVICASMATRSDLMFRTPFDGDGETVYQGVGRLDTGPTEARIDLLYVGSLIERKDPDFLRRTIATASEEGNRCVAVNFSDIELPCETYRDVSRERLARLYAEARYYIHPSRAEGFGRGAVEAQAYGAVPLARDIPVNNEVLGEKGESWYTVETPEAVVRRLAGKPSRREQRAARENSKRFDWDQAAAEIYELLRTSGEQKG